MNRSRWIGILGVVFCSGFLVGSFTHRRALHSCIDELSGDSRELVNYAGTLEEQNSYLREGVDMLTEHLLDCERNQSIGCVRGAYYPRGQ
jgi:hypothetical protein